MHTLVFMMSEQIELATITQWQGKASIQRQRQRHIEHIVIVQYQCTNEYMDSVWQTENVTLRENGR